MRQEGKSNIKDASLNDIALAELVSYIFETQRNSKESVVFRLADLVSLYQERLATWFEVLASSYYPSERKII